MSNKKWRNPAGVEAKPAVDPSIPVQDPRGSGTSLRDADASRNVAQEPRPAARSSLSDQQVMDILDLGAKFIHNFLGHAIDTLGQVGIQEVKRVALEQDPPVHSHATPQHRPRGRVHPLLLLVKLGVSATALVQRIFKVTHPHMFPAGREKRERVMDSAEKFMGMVKKAMPDVSPGPA